MDKIYQHKSVEERWYKLWEENGYFKPSPDSSQQPFTIILPPPNANADLHVGHAMYTVEDIMIRYHRMKGDNTLWLAGADHAGFETQFVFEKHLSKEGKSRFDYTREELYRMIWDFVHKNRGNMENQLKRLGFSLDWSRNVFTLDPNIVHIVYGTFKKLYDDGLVYRSKRLVNYCTKCGTGFSDLEVKYVERPDPLYYLKYGPFTLATVRPETKFGDTAVAVHPKDKRYNKWIGKEIEVEGLLGNFKIKVIGDQMVDPEFGTGVVKVTPAHDFNDFEMGKKHNLPIMQVIGYDGRLNDKTGPYKGMKVKAAREKIVEDLRNRGLIEKIDTSYIHNVATCYKCGSVLEPLPLPQWYIRIEPLKKKALESVKKNKITFVPRRFKKTAIQWLTNFHDWNISRQIVWGIRIPAWKCKDCDSNKQLDNETMEQWIVTDGEKPERCPGCHGTNLEQDTDTFDTWFSSGQWPFATLLTAGDSQIEEKEGVITDPNPSSDYNRFYPTSVMETGYDILPWWVCRMIMLGLYRTGKTPFTTVYLHGLVKDAKGQKMSKSRGNVINPLAMIDTYGSDSLRMALIYAAAGGADIALSEDKIRGMRNFSNKLWNIGRFLMINQEFIRKSSPHIPSFSSIKQNATEKKMIREVNKIHRQATRFIDNYQFGQAAEIIYEFTWHTFADKYIEESKEELKNNNSNRLVILFEVYKRCLTLLHPFMPFITEEIHSHLFPNTEFLITSAW